MIEKKIEKLKRYQANINVHFISVYEELLSELDNISWVSGWIPETKQISPDIQAIVDKKSYNLI